LAGSSSNTLYYLHGDHLGSTTVATFGSGCGALVATQLYFPFGKVRYASGTLPTGRGFTGQILDSNGLMYYGARYFDPLTARWTQPDTIVPEPGNPQALNRYSYANNAPLRYVDPSGHDGIDALTYLFGVAYGWAHANLAALGPLVPQPAMQQFEALAVDSNAFAAGRVIGGLAAAAQGVGEVGGGSGIAASGAALCGTVLLCLAGAPAMVEGLAIAGHGAAVGVYGAAEAGQQSAVLFAKSQPGGGGSQRPLVYGPSAGGRLRGLANRLGGNTLTDESKPPGVSWAQFSTQTLDQAAASGRTVYFDLTYADDIQGMLAGTGRYGNTITAYELRYIRDNWDLFESNVIFLENGGLVGMPW